MNRRWHGILLLAGAAFLALLVRRTGLAEIAADAESVGWLFVPVLLLYGVAYACNTEAWRLSMPRDGVRPSFWRTYAITVSGFSLNFVTPLVNAGGEPYRAAAVAPWLGRRQAATSVIVHRVQNTLALLLTWLTALLLALVLLPRSAPLVGALLAAAATIGVLAWLLMHWHRHRVLESALDLRRRLPLPGGVAGRIESKRGALAEMDEYIAEAHRASPGRFWAALALEYTGRCLYAVEYWLICFGMGIPASFPKIYLIAGLSSFVLNALFLVPFELGSKEGILYLLFDLTGLDPHAGVSMAIVSRARDLLWIAVGLALLSILRPRQSAPAPAAEIAGP